MTKSELLNVLDYVSYTREQYLLGYERIARLYSAMVKTTASYNFNGGGTGSGYSDKMADKLGMLQELQEQQAAKAVAYLEAVKAAINAIETIADTRQRIILKLRYLDGMSYAAIGKTLKLSAVHCRRLQEKALEALETC